MSNQIDDYWIEMFEQIEYFYTSHGRMPHCRSSIQYERILGYWRNYQIEYYKKGLMCDEKIKKVENSCSFMFV